MKGCLRAVPKSSPDLRRGQTRPSERALAFDRRFCDTSAMGTPIPPIIGTLEAALYAADLDEAEAFWTGVIGLRVFQKVNGRHVFFRVVEGQPAQVLLVFNPDATRKPPGAGARLPVPPHGAEGAGHYCLAVAPDAMDAWRAHLAGAGVAIEADFLWPNGRRSIYVRDPAGNSIELADPAIWG